MPHQKRIEKLLCQNVVQVYCPELGKHWPPSRSECLDPLLLAINDRWKLQFNQLLHENTFNKALRGEFCSPAMREKMAILYYAGRQQPPDPELIKPYLEIVHRKQLPATPHWDRFVAEHQQTKPDCSMRCRWPKSVKPCLTCLSVTKKKRVIIDLLKDLGWKGKG